MPAQRKTQEKPGLPALSRRSVLRGSLLLSFTPFLLPALAGCSKKAPASTSLKDLTAAQAAADPVVADGWSYRPDLVKRVVQLFEKQYSESVTFQLIPGDYSSAMTSKMIAKSPVYGMYIKADAARFLTAGWITPLNDLENYDKIKKDMAPAFFDALSFEGKLTALPYYGSAKGMVCYNEDILTRAGVTADKLPKTWDEMYDVCREVKSQGILKNPLIPFWSSGTDGIMDAWLAESMNRGDEIVDSNMNCVLSSTSGAADALRAWNKAYKDELAPRNILTVASEDARAIFQSGQAAFVIMQDYNLNVVNDPTQSKIAGKAKMLPSVDQAWGILDYGGYAVPTGHGSGAKLQEERGKRWVEFMGYRDKEGKLTVAKEWLITANLTPAYAELREDPDVIAAQKKWMPDFPGTRDVMAANFDKIVAPRPWKALWYSAWATYVATVLPDAITGKTSVDEVIDGIKAQWNEQKKATA